MKFRITTVPLNIVFLGFKVKYLEKQNSCNVNFKLH